ncbi:hypothetical protein [Aliikangiella maris]|uniref:Uncharacterized protein n=2 Tax=Aliikangiella maris TaxID=3162458 RepID=A0ABV3MI47_9GAMM
MQSKFIQFVIYLLLSALIACGGPKQALISPAEIQSAQQSGNLLALYDKVSNMVMQNKGSAKEEAIAIQSEIAQLLTQQKKQQVAQVVAQFNQEGSSITREQLLDLKSSVQSMQQWSATDFARISPQINQMLAQINQLIATYMNVAIDPNKEPVAQILALKRAAELAGESQPETSEYQNAHKKMLAQLQSNGNTQLERRNYEQALAAAKGGLLLDANNIQFESLMSQAEAGLFENDFRKAIENGKPESAYQAVIEVSDKPIFLQLKKNMRNSIILLSNYFAGSAQKAYVSGDWVTAYVNFIKGRTIQDKLDIADKGFIQEKKYLDMLMSKVNKGNVAEGQQLILLKIIQEFDDKFPNLQNQLRKIEESIKSRAMTKLSVAAFKEIPATDSVVNSVGRRVGSKLEKILFERLGHEVTIVAQLTTEQSNPYEGLTLKVDGEVLQAAVENSTNIGKRNLRVQTGVNRTETEAYQKWVKRKRGEQPEQYIETPVMENVELTVEHILKHAIAEVAFRIIEPASGTILLTDNFVEESEFSGESINELQKGEFHQPYVRADLPSDITIMDELASKLAERLGNKLAEYLQSPENVFFQKSEDSTAQGNVKLAVEMLANAVTIGEAKGKDVSVWYEKAKRLALQ